MCFNNMTDVDHTNTSNRGWVRSIPPEGQETSCWSPFVVPSLVFRLQTSDGPKGYREVSGRTKNGQCS